MSSFNFNLTSNVASRAKEPEDVSVTMEIEEHNPRFMKAFKRFEPKVKDSTVYQLLKKCPRLYFYQAVLGRVPNQNNVVLDWGSTYHIFREHLEKAYGIGVHTTYNQPAGHEAFAIAAEKALKYWKLNGVDQQPDSKYAHMTTGRLVQSLKKAFEHWQAEKRDGRKVVVASEQIFNVKLDSGVRIGGRADQMLRWNGSLWGRDFKTTTKDSDFYVRLLEPNHQFTHYTLADSKLSGEFVQGQIIELLYNAKPTKSDPKGPLVIELPTSRTPQQLEQFEKELTVIDKTLQIYRETDVWPMHEASCPFCPFHSVCKKPTEAAQMAQLEQDYTLRPWDFSKIGDADAA